MSQNYQWTRETARLASRKGLLARLKVAPERQPEYRKGYQAGWVSCERFYRRMRQEEEKDLARLGFRALVGNPATALENEHK